MWLLPRLRLALARRPWLYWLVVAVCGGVMWLHWSSVLDAAERSRRAWGDTRPVAVAVDGGAPGTLLRVEVRDYPMAMVPVDALAAAPPDPVAARTVPEGAMLQADDVVGTDTVPTDWVVLAIPSHDAPSFVTGQGSAVFAAGERRCDGRVSGLTEDHVEVAVPPACAESLTVDLVAGGVVLARLP